MTQKRCLRVLYGAISCVAASALAATAWAGGRPDDTTRSWFGEFYGGWAMPQGDSDDILDDDWTIGGSALYWPSDWSAGIKFELAYTSFDVSNRALDAINAAIAQDPNNSGRIDGGDVDTWQLTVNGIWGPGDRSNGLYLTGGIGAYHLKGTLTETGLVYYPPFCDPWYWWWCFPGGVGTGNIIRGSGSATEFGWNAGLGYSFGAGDGQVFIEAKYHSINTDSEDLTYLPIIFGYRW